MRSLIIASGAVFLVYVLFKQTRSFIDLHFALSPERALFGLELWQPLTALFTHVGDNALVPFAIDALLLWLMGSPLERELGRRDAILFFLGTGFVGYLACAAIALTVPGLPPQSGAEPALFAFMAGFGILYGRTQVLAFGAVPARADIISWIFCGIWLLRHLIAVLFERQISAVALLGGDLAALGAAFIFIRRGVPSFGLRTLSLKIDRLRLWWLRRRYKVLDGGKGKDEQKWMN